MQQDYISTLNDCWCFYQKLIEMKDDELNYNVLVNKTKSMQSIELLKISKTHHFPSINLAYIFQAILRLIHQIPSIPPPELFHRVQLLVESFGYCRCQSKDKFKCFRFYFCTNTCKLESAIECFLRNLTCLLAHFTNLFAAIIDLIDMTPESFQPVFIQPIYTMILSHNWSYIDTVFRNPDIMKQLQFYYSDSALLEYSRTYLLRVYKMNKLLSSPMDKSEGTFVGNR